MIASKLDAAIKLVCPIFGVSIGRRNDKATWRIDFKDEATASERTAAQGVVDAFDEVAADAPIDESDSNNLEKRMKAILRLIAQYHGKSGPEIRADYKAIWDSMP